MVLDELVFHPGAEHHRSPPVPSVRAGVVAFATPSRRLSATVAMIHWTLTATTRRHVREQGG